ncbi:response regulator transcription factor [Serratia fonticola]|uniref:response regulator transcription factor n=1 Tax=Serratia fonticola TaxID=47917 RepID=UPI002178A407|nr:response regulator transcription factor [Serratia fonticola]CAI1647089.1 Capsular synthesis regulator component B [Serratia fonticola]CAI1708233.1 Capsular synthesis regulator component B [Serratia fonticola]CAI1886710.1 Capsular synthesis regulator component B [Serratia fonticola]
MRENENQWHTLLMESCPITREGIKQALLSSKCLGEEVVDTNEVSKIPLLVSQYKPQLIIMELYGLGESVLDALRIINICRASWPHIPIVICTAIENSCLLTLIRNMGVRGMCLKSESLTSIVSCISQVVKGNYFFSDRIVANLDKNIHSCIPLTSKEIDVLELIFSGKTVTATSSMMHRDIRTVSTHKRNAMEKLGFKNDGEMFIQGDWMFKQKLFS